ncbi:hypothetical protein ACA910_015973 [Epithemia clementina (nom. ined.)]
MVKPKKFLNEAPHAVEEFIEGLLLQYPNHLVQLEHHKNVVLCSKRTSSSHVQLVCGGGSGHEPAHAGYLGQGMLSAAVCGGMFASPSVSSVLAAIRALAATGENCGGVLVVIKNYTGDRLNFGMAAEKAAQQHGILVQTVVVADDCALSRTKGITGARGVAGTVLVNKIAGGAAAAGKTLDEVAQMARLVCRRMGTLGVALNSVTLPGAESINDRLDEHTIEIGLGIHGEAGMRQSPLLSAHEVAREMITTIQTYGRREADNDDGTIVPMMAKGDEVAILVNNLGGTSNFEMSILARSCVQLLESEEFGVQAKRVFVGSYMTSFDMHGASLTILNVTGQAEMLQYMDAPTSAPAWTACDIWDGSSPRPSIQPVPEPTAGDETALELSKPPLQQLDGFAETAKKMITAASTQLAESEPLLTKYDTIVGDGDCGTTMKRGALEILNRLQQQDSSDGAWDHPVTLYNALAGAVSASMGGTSGVLLELLFRKMSLFLSARCDSIGPHELSLALQAGVDALIYYGGAQVGSRTMLDALVPAAAALLEATSSSNTNTTNTNTNDNNSNLAEAAVKARQGADATAQMATASAGRSNYLSEESLSGTPDPGAVAVAIVFESMAAAAALTTA